MQGIATQLCPLSFEFGSLPKRYIGSVDLEYKSEFRIIDTFLKYKMAWILSFMHINLNIRLILISTFT